MYFILYIFLFLRGEHLSNPIERMEKLRDEIKEIHAAAKQLVAAEEWKPPLTSTAQRVSDSLSSSSSTKKSSGDKKSSNSNLASHAAKEPIGPLRYLAKSKLKELRELYWKSLHSVDHPNETLRTGTRTYHMRILFCVCMIPRGYLFTIVLKITDARPVFHVGFDEMAGWRGREGRKGRLPFSAENEAFFLYL